jgi:hypothetical protein
LPYRPRETTSSSSTPGSVPWQGKADQWGPKRWH